ncbi:MAG: hypothetical protein J5J06_19690 [Phycisphaerae bacterium]|nr:hypothetical protein [Phycisphaerae bacterium]
MIQCETCEYFHRGADGKPRLMCDPFATIKEPECLAKWQLVRLQSIADSHEATLAMYRRFAPLQEKLFRHVEREIEDAEDADRWKYDADDPDDEDDRDDPFRV